MSTKITAENGAGIAVGQLGITVAHPEGIATIWARLSQEQRRALADALRGREPGDEYVDWKTMYDQARSERDAAVYAYDKAERERDEEKAARREAWEHLDRAADRVVHEQIRAQDAERERDEAVARAEAAEARTAPAVSPADVEQAIRAEFRDEGFYLKTPVEYRVFRAVCDLLPVEAGQATDPVEELAEQIESATREAIRQVCVDLADVAPSLDPLAVEQAMEVTAASRKVAAHVLGQEASIDE